MSDNVLSHQGSYAKGEEDLWLIDQFPQGFTGYAVELGALDGTTISCTKLLEERGWTVLCIEPNPRHQSALRSSRRLVMTCACDREPSVKATMWEDPTTPGFTLTSLQPDGVAVIRDRTAWTSFVTTVLTLDQCLMVAGFPSLDVLVLDVDGIEARIIQGFDIDRWNPKAVIVEGEADDRLVPFLSRGYKQVGIRPDDNRLLVRGVA